MSVRHSRRLVAAGLVAVMAAGCAKSAASPSLDGAAPAATSEPGTAVGGTSFWGLLSQVRSDYEPAKDLVSLAGRSDIVVQGRIVEASSGPTLGGKKDDPAGRHLVVFRVQTERVLKGSRTDNVYVAYDTAADTAVEDYQGSLPNERAVLFLRTVQVDRATADDPDAGRPQGQPLYQLTSPQGILTSAPGHVTNPLGEPVPAISNGARNVDDLTI